MSLTVAEVDCHANDTPYWLIVLTGVALLQVYGLPTLILFKDGNMVKGSLKEGAITKPMLLKYLEKYGIAKEVAK